MATTHWKVDGMTCSNCSLTISRYLQKQGKTNVRVNLISGDVAFEEDTSANTDQVISGIEALGYSVHTASREKPARRKLFRSHLQRFWFCAIFTAPLMLHMFDGLIHLHWLMNPWVQLLLCLPVYVIGMDFFGRSAVKSIRNGMPNMNVLIAIGATAAFAYSLAGTLAELGPDYQFYETAAAIITLVFLGNYLEDASIASTQRSLQKLAGSQKTMANMIAFDEAHQEVIMPIDNEQLRPGDLVLIRAGEQVPADAKILTGTASVNEAIITGESMPVEKKPKDRLIGGSVVTDGILKAQVTAEARHSVLANIVDLVKQAQGEKPPVQQMADRISAVFVPVVLGIALITFLANLALLGSFGPSLMRAIAVLVIACPCAMGLATPAAIAVGLGRAARNGVLFRNARSLENFRNIRQAVFDKTGTLTTGEFSISAFHTEITEEEFKTIVYSLEKYSGHPIASSIAREWKQGRTIRWAETHEVKGAGMTATSVEGIRYTAGTFGRPHGDQDGGHNVYVTRNNELIGWIDVRDTVRPEAAKIIAYLKARSIRTILLSGDRRERCEELARQLGIDEVFAEQTPEQKLQAITELNRRQPTVMIGDGINDAPALAKATIGVSLSEASQIAVQTADVVLMNKGLTALPLSLGLGRHTYLTIRQNLFWAFLYNIVAIPVAAFGFLTPAFGALVMGMSDVVLAVNSVRLYVKKVV